MKHILIILFIAAALGTIKAQGIGEIVPDKKPEAFPPHTIGLDLMFTEGGFGFGGFYRKELGEHITGFIDFSISEAKDEREFEYVDYYGQTYVAGKKNRVFTMPLSFGVQYRMFEDAIADNLRPYVNGGIGPSFVVTTPYEMEFFDSFGKARGKWALGGYVGIGANFGLDKKNLIGLNLRYYFTHFFDNGVESLANVYHKDLGGIALAINIGIMY